MTPIFADTSYCLALLSPRDQYHDAAVQLGGELRRPVILTEFILLELANFFSADEGRARLAEFWMHLKQETFVTIVPASSELLNRGFDLFARRPDKNWSLTDCTSFTVMGELGLSEALTADRHFEQAGFTILLK
jgi:predicted nucleic acid-binding protein